MPFFFFDSFSQKRMFCLVTNTHHFPKEGTKTMSTSANIHLSITETNGRTTQMVWNVRHDGYPAAILETLKKVVGFADNRDDGEVDDIGDHVEAYLLDSLTQTVRDGAYPFPDELSYQGRKIVTPGVERVAIGLRL
jgi:hypothetical protein